MSDLEEEGETAVVTLISATHSAQQNQRSGGRFAAVHRERWCVEEKWTGALGPQCGLHAHLEGYTQDRDRESISWSRSRNGELGWEREQEQEQE